MALRVLPPQLRQLPTAERSVYIQALEAICPAGGRTLSAARKAGLINTGTKSPGFTARLSEPPACTVFDPQQENRDSSFFASLRSLSAYAGSTRQTLPQPFIPPEPETRNGLSLARNDAFATITRSMLPPCSFVSTPEILANPFDPKLLRSVWFRSQTGRIQRLRPVVCNVLRRFRDVPRSPLPFRPSAFQIKAFDPLPSR